MIKVHRKPSSKNCSGKTNICNFFVGDTVSQETFERIYNICPIKKFSGGGRVIGNDKVGGFKS